MSVQRTIVIYSTIVLDGAVPQARTGGLLRRYGRLAQRNVTRLKVIQGKIGRGLVQCKAIGARAWTWLIRARRNGLFICYKREDTDEIAATIADIARDRFKSRVAVFLDREAISAGEDYRVKIEKHIARSRLMFLLVGKVDIDTTEIAFEEQAATRYGVDVIPILINGARLPARYARSQAIELRASDRKHDLDRIRSEIDQRFVDRTTTPLVVMLVVALLYLCVPQGSPPVNGFELMRRSMVESQEALAKALGLEPRRAEPDRAPTYTMPICEGADSFDRFTPIELAHVSAVVARSVCEGYFENAPDDFVNIVKQCAGTRSRSEIHVKVSRPASHEDCDVELKIRSHQGRRWAWLRSAYVRIPHFFAPQQDIVELRGGLVTPYAARWSCGAGYDARASSKVLPGSGMVSLELVKDWPEIPQELQRYFCGQ